MGSLTVTRRSGEKLHITTPEGRLIIVAIDRITGAKARINVTADELVVIERDELLSDKDFRESGLDSV